MKYILQKGDRVKLNPSLKENTQYGGLTFWPKMAFEGEVCIGEPQTMAGVDLKPTIVYPILHPEDGLSRYYTEEMLIPLDGVRKEKPLKVGDYVILIEDLQEGAIYGGVVWDNRYGFCSPHKVVYITDQKHYILEGREPIVYSAAMLQKVDYPAAAYVAEESSEANKDSSIDTEPCIKLAVKTKAVKLDFKN